MRDKRLYIVNTCKNIFFIFTSFFLIDWVQAQTEITGFFDVTHTSRLMEKQTDGFNINQFEIDISRSYKDHLSFGAAIAYNNASNNFNLSIAYLHYNIFKDGIKYPRRTEEDEHAGIVIGKFDVPIGLDYLSYASPDRPVVSQPLIIEQTIAGWNDIGLNLHLNNKYYKFNLSVVNGFNNGVNFVGDWVFKFTSGLQLGLFHTSDFNKKLNRKGWINGTYFLAGQGMFELKSEFIWASGIYGGEQDTLNENHYHNGFYVQLVSDLSKKSMLLPIFFTLRYSLWQNGNTNSLVLFPEKIDRYVLGIGHRLNNYSSLRLEYLMENPECKKRFDRLTAQLVVRF